MDANKFQITLTNLSPITNYSITLFELGNDSSINNIQYRFGFAYVADYDNSKYQITVNGTTTTLNTVTGATTPVQMAAILTALGYGTFQVESDPVLGTMFWVNHSTNVFASVKIGLVTRTATVVNVVGDTQIQVTGAVSYKTLLESLIGTTYFLNCIDIYSTNRSQVQGAITYNTSEANGNKTTDTFVASLNKFQRVNLTSVNCKDGAVLNGKNSFGFTVLADTEVLITMNYESGDKNGCRLLKDRELNDFLKSIKKIICE